MGNMTQALQKAQQLQQQKRAAGGGGAGSGRDALAAAPSEASAAPGGANDSGAVPALGHGVASEGAAASQSAEDQS